MYYTKFDISNSKLGYYVVFYFSDSSDDMIESISHAARFTDLAAAQRFLEKVRNAFRKDKFKALNLAHWNWAATKCSPFTFMHERSTAEIYVVPAKPRNPAIDYCSD